MRFVSMRVRNFYSIGDITIDFKNGFYKIVATNYDISDGNSGSNGAGKSSLMAALSQALFNRNPKNDDPSAKVADTCNHVTGKCYEITVDFEIGEDSYRVINSRENGAFIKVFKNGEDISVKTMKGSLRLISDLIGLNYESFIALTFLSQSTINSLLFSSNPESLLNRFLSLNKINNYEAHLKVVQKDLKKDLVVLTTKSEGITGTLKVLEEFEPINTEDLLEEKATYVEELYDLEHSENKDIITMLRSRVENVKQVFIEAKNDYLEINKEYSIYVELLEDMKKSSVCPTCGQSIKQGHEHSNTNNTIEEKLEELSERRKESYKKVQGIQKDYEKMQFDLAGYEKDFEDKLAELNDKINQVDNKLAVIEAQRKEYESAKAKKEILEESLKTTEEEIRTVRDYLTFTETALKVVRSGAIQQEYFKNFVIYMQKEVNSLVEKFSFPYKIKVKATKKTVVYTFLKITDEGLQEISFHSLSSGEKTRVSLMVLIATLNTLQLTTGVQLGFLVFDEFLSVLDDEGIKLFTEIVKEISTDKTVFVVQHHDEIPDEVFDGVLAIEKRKGVTLLKEESNE